MQSTNDGFFRSFLREHNQPIDRRYNADDEAAFVFGLVQLRLARTYLIPVDRHDLLERAQMGVELVDAVRFVASFLCFFIAKPAQYNREIKEFKEYYIPNFSTDVSKQEQLKQSVEVSFSMTPLNEADWHSVSAYFGPYEPAPLGRSAPV